MMLESIRKLMRKCEEDSGLHVPCPRQLHTRVTDQLSQAALTRKPLLGQLGSSPTPSSCAPASQSAVTSRVSCLRQGVGGGGSWGAGGGVNHSC
jgi:hypothetical protein